MSTCSHAHKNTVLLNDKAFYTISSSGMSCKFSRKAFNRGFNPRRHENEYCPLKSEEREMSETESKTMNSEDDASTTSTHGSESMVTDSEMETEKEEREEEKDSWMPMVEEAMQKHKAAFEEMKLNYIESGMDRQSADQKAYSDILSKLQKELASIYLQRLQWIQQLRKIRFIRK